MCEGDDDVGSHDGLRAHKVTHATQGETLTSAYYINQVKQLTSRDQVSGGPIERKLFSSKKEITFVQDGGLAHNSKATQTCCQKKFAKLYSHSEHLEYH